MSRGRILVVDDEPGMLRSVERVLRANYEVATAGSAREALATAEGFRPELAILDIRMPEVDGFELMSRLRDAHSDVDVIFMTGAIHEVDSQLIRSIREKAFYFVQKPFDREVLLTLVDRCLPQRRLAEENRTYLARLEDELREARRFQQGLLPAPHGRFGPLTIDASYRPCDALGGDLFDFVDVGDGRATLLVADVSGHGVSAAMLTAIVKSAFREAHGADYGPRDVVRRIANGLRCFGDERFVTLFCGRICPEEGLLEYVNAGHPPVLVWGAERERSELALTGPLVSPAFPDLEWEQDSLELSRGDRLLVYTDGITEARGPAGLFGEERLGDLVRGAADTGAELLDEIHRAVWEFADGRPQDDDQTLLTATLA